MFHHYSINKADGLRYWLHGNRWEFALQLIGLSKNFSFKLSIGGYHCLSWLYFGSN